MPKRYARLGPLVDIYPSMPDSEGERIEALWRTHYRDVLAYAWRRVGDEAGAADVAAETFLIAWRRLDSTPDPSRAWLLAIARRVVANELRSGRRREALYAKVVAASERPGSEAGGDRVELVEAFNALSAGDREVLSLVTWQELKPREAATVLGISPALFSVRLHRARARLRKELERAGHNPVNATAPRGAAATPPDPTQLRTESE